MEIKKVTALLFFAASSLLLVCCHQAGDSKEPIDVIKEEAAIKAVLTDMWDAIEKKDIERYANSVHPDFTQFGENDSVLLVSKAAEVAGIKSWMEQSSNVHTEMIDPKVTIKGNVAWVVYYWSDAGISNEKPFASHGKSTRIFVKENDRWLCIHGHYTLLP